LNGNQPEMDGFALLRHLSETAPELPAIVISGQGERGDVIQALRRGAWDYICKPIENGTFPYLDELASRNLDPRTTAYLNIIRSNIDQLVYPVSTGLGGAYRNLTLRGDQRRRSGAPRQIHEIHRPPCWTATRT
jgi:hypothetical protein